MTYHAPLKAALLAGCTLFSSAAFAQAAVSSDPSVIGSDPDANANSDENAIVVTALRRDTNLQQTPASVTAISGDELASRGISTVENLVAIVPGVTFGKNIGQVSISVRGIGSDGVVALLDPRVGFYQDGVYVGRPDAQAAGIFDVDSVQVLKGPQGTLYGRNATGGAVVVTSARPTFDMDGYVRAGYGNYNAVKLEMAVGGPVSDKLAARFGGHYQRHDGYGRNEITGTRIDDKDELGVRGSLLFRPSDTVDMLTIVDYSYESDRANGLHYITTAQPGQVSRGVLRGGRFATNVRDIASDADPRVMIKTYGVTEQISIDTNFAEITSITGYRKIDTVNVTDVDGTSVQLGVDRLFNKSDQFSQELTATGKAGRISWLLGGQYFHENIGPSGAEIPLNRLIFGLPSFLTDGFATLARQKTDSFAAYGQVGIEILDGLTLTAGGRYSTEKKQLIGNILQIDTTRPYVPGFADITPNPGFPRSDSIRFSDFTPTATLEYAINPDIFVYLTYSEGFKSGGYAIGSGQAPYRPETIKSFEGGIKTTLANGLVTANAIGFHYDYSDLQVTQVRGTSSFTENAASAKVDGLELELALKPTRGLVIGANYSFIDARYGNFVSVDPSNPVITNCIAGGIGTVDSTGNCVQDLAGNRMSQAPKHSYLIYAGNTFSLPAGDFTLRGDYNYKGKQFFTPFENDRTSQRGYGILSASARYEAHEGWFVEAYARNISNKLAVSQVYVSSLSLFGAPVLGTLIEPRTYGATVGFNF